MEHFEGDSRNRNDFTQLSTVLHHSLPKIQIQNEIHLSKFDDISEQSLEEYPGDGDADYATAKLEEF